MLHAESHADSPADSAAPPSERGDRDRELIAAAQTGDYDAFESLVDRYRDRVYRLAYGMTHDRTDAEEVVQEAFLNLFRSLRTYRGAAEPSTWIYRIAVNAALMRLRTKRRKPLLSIEEYVPSSSDGSVWESGAWARQPDDKLLDQELQRELQAAIDALAPKYRVVFLLRDVEGLTNAQIAVTLGLTLPTVKARLHRSRLALRKALERYFEKK